MTRLLISSGQGPAECRMAVRHVLARMKQECGQIDVVEKGDKHGPASAVVSVQGPDAEQFAKAWTGTIQWVCKSSLRPNHKRQNWFVGVFTLPEVSQKTSLDLSDVRFDTFRAGGPGGQHQNTTDSAVRATHTPTGLSVVARDERSQHRNKQAAIARLQTQLAAQVDLELAASKKETNLSHHLLERGNPVRRFKGVGFVEL